MGESTSELTGVFEQMHFGKEVFRAKGTFQSVRGKGWVNRVICWFIGVPISAQPKEFIFEINPVDGSWKRTFCSHAFTTKTKMEGGVFKESKGIFDFEFNLVTQVNTMRYDLISFKTLKIPIPKKWQVIPKAFGEQTGTNTWNFQVEIFSPLNHLVLCYKGEAEVIVDYS